MTAAKQKHALRVRPGPCSWRAWKRRLVAIAASLEPEAEYVFDRELPIYVRNLHPAESRRAVRAIREFGSARQWPVAMTRAVTTQLDVRLRFGIYVCHSAAEQRLPRPWTTFERVIEWLLIDRFSRRRAEWADRAAEADFF